MFRAYARLGIVVALAVAIAAGVAVDDLLTRARSGSVTTRRVALAATVCLLGLTVLEFAPIPWRSRDVLPTRAHRWLTEQGEAVRALDCTRFSLAEQSVPWLLGSHAIEFLQPPFEDCGDPLLVGSMMARGFTHLIVRTVHDRETSGVDAAGFMLLRSYPDSRVYRVPSGVPVVTREVEGFYPWEREPELRRWMGQKGQWRVRNLAGRPVHATLRVELNAFERTRTLDVRLEDVSIQVNVVPAAAPIRSVRSWSRPVTASLRSAVSNRLPVAVTSSGASIPDRSPSCSASGIGQRTSDRDPVLPCRP